MTRIVRISGSLRCGSYNTSLLRAAAQLMPNNAQLRIETIREIPLYDGDLEAAEGIPQPVTALKEAVASADGLLLATPEYNNSIPGVFKNRDRLALATAGRHSPCFRREVGCTDWGLARRLRHYSQPECLASCLAHTWCRAVV